MKRKNKYLFFLLLIVLSLLLVSCGDEKKKTTDTSSSTPLGAMKKYLNAYVSYAVSSTATDSCFLIKNSTAKEVLGINDGTAETKYSYKVNESKTYKKDDEITKALEYYVDRNLDGDTSKIQASAIVGYTWQTTTNKDKVNEVSYYAALIKVGGKWYILEEKKTNDFSDAEDFFLNMH